MIGETRLAQAKRGVEKPGVVDSMNSPRNHRSAMKPFDRKNKQPSTTLFHLSNWLNGKTTGDQYLQQLEAFVKENPRDLEAWASLINFRLYQHGPSITAVEMGMQQPATTDSVLTQMGTRFARSIADVLGAQYTSALNDLPEIDQEYGPTANRYQTERRNLLLRSRTSMSEQIWTCAVDMVKNNPTRAIDVLRQEHELGHPTLKRAVTMLFPPPLVDHAAGCFKHRRQKTMEPGPVRCRHMRGRAAARGRCRPPVEVGRPSRIRRYGHGDQMASTHCA